MIRSKDCRMLVALLTLEYLLDQIGLELFIPGVLGVLNYAGICRIGHLVFVRLSMWGKLLRVP
jgi:hypothetical protein